MVSAIVLAAGSSTRMGSGNKLLLPIKDKPLIARVVDNVLGSLAAEVVVVLGHEAERVRAALWERPVTFAENLDFEQGMTTSIHAGVQAASPGTDGYMICLGDLPWITADDFSHLIRAFESRLETGERAIIIPTFHGRRGNPVIFSARFRPEILEHQGLMGCKGTIESHPDLVLEVEMPNEHVLRDIDTAEQYRLVTERGQ